MLKLEDIEVGLLIAGIESSHPVEVIARQPQGEHAVNVIYKDPQGNLLEQMLFRSDEGKLSTAETGCPWTFDAPGEEFKLAVEAQRINLAHLFDPMMAVHTSNVDPLPHQITAVYESMLPKQPLRYVLADDPGAGKTIMAGLLIRELIIRGDAQRILVVCPGSLVEQWQDELLEKFGLLFEIFSREMLEADPVGNPFDTKDRLVARIDQLSRSDELLEKLSNTEWDLVIVDEAHKMSASFFGQKLKETKRFKLGKLLSKISRHYLMMTATPHNGKEEDFQLFMSLLDGDRFYGKFRDGAHKVDIDDMMRRMVKEELLKFDGTPLFPERRAYTVNYSLSPFEEALYFNVTQYVREEMNKADNLDGKRKGTVGFALTILQRRLASSPEAIYQSLARRRARLEKRVRDEKIQQRGGYVSETMTPYGSGLPESNDVKFVYEPPAPYGGEIEYTPPPVRTVCSPLDKLNGNGDFDDLDEQLTDTEFEDLADQLVDQATTARTIQELESEIEILKGLEAQAYDVVQSGQDRKWDELSRILQEQPEMKDGSGARRKLIIFTEHKDTLNYLSDRIKGLLGDPDSVVAIHGGVHRDERRRIQEKFRNHPEVVVLLATDAAGEGVNLQNANLMVNYDLPWNPNRLEQRFGRIHRIGQREVCHLWNIVAKDTREGDVFIRLFEKLEIERKALGGRVFDILGEVFEERSLKDMLIDAIRYGDDPEVRARLERQVEGALDPNHLKEIMKRNSLTEEVMTQDQLFAVKEEMEKAEARKLQPFFIRAFFMEAFKNLNGELRQREEGRFEIRNVPAVIRERDRQIGGRDPVTKRYDRVCFERHLVHVYNKPMASLLHPAHPLMNSVTDLILEAHRPKLKRGSVLVDPTDDGTKPKVLVMLDHSVREKVYGYDDRRVCSRRMQFVTIDEEGSVTSAGWAPHLDFQPLDGADQYLIQDILKARWLCPSLEDRAKAYAASHLVTEHFEEVRARREEQVDKTLQAVHERLNKEILHWQDRYLHLKDAVDAGKQPRMQPENARRRAEELDARLDQRTKELNAQREVVSSPPLVVGGALVVPAGLLAQRKGEELPLFSVNAQRRLEVEQLAMRAVFERETENGYSTRDVSADKCGWDISAYKDGCVDRHIEVKGRAKGQTTITVTRNEIMYALNQSEKFRLAIVLVDESDNVEGPYYVPEPFTTEPDWGVASINYNLNELLSKASHFA